MLKLGLSELDIVAFTATEEFDKIAENVRVT